MSSLIRALGDDPMYQGRKAPAYVAANAIVAVHPLWAVQHHGQLWQCTHDHKNARIVSYLLIDVHGKQYTCGNRLELQKLGIGDNQNMPEIGFVTREGEEPDQVATG